MLLVDSARVSERMQWSDLDDEVANAIAGDKDLIAEAYAWVQPDGSRFGQHHEVRDGVLILNRGAVYSALGTILCDSQWVLGQEQHPAWPLRMPTADRVAALAHLRAHAQVCEEVPVGE